MAAIPPAQVANGKTERIALIGYGAIGVAVHRLLREHAGHQVEVVAILVRDRDRALQLAPEEAPLLVDTLPTLLGRHPTLIVECAGHGAVDDYAAAVLQAGVDLLMVSVGALADAGREKLVLSALQRGGRKLILPSGAIGGIDWLGAARTAGLRQVTYRSRKPPQAWAGSAAEKQLDLAAINIATLFFHGSAREAALLYPRNANVAATVALATLGFDDTQVELMADPRLDANVHEIEAEGQGGRMALRLEGFADARNPRSSVMTAHSVVRSILKRSASVLM
ncbi:MAG: aspartate dehydrogenase [Pseudomonadota bacterium]